MSRAPVQSERSLHEQMADLLELALLPPVMWTTFPAFGYGALTEVQAGVLSRLGVQAGWPDIILVHDGRVFGIELKRVGGQLSRTRLVRTRSGSMRVVEGQRDVHPRLAWPG
jgi:hypothetical protein